MKARCDTQDPSSGGYGTRCIRRDGHGGDHRDAFGDVWPDPEPHDSEPTDP